MVSSPTKLRKRIQTVYTFTGRKQKRKKMKQMELKDHVNGNSQALRRNQQISKILIYKQSSTKRGAEKKG